jgi:hypothetical protein
MLAAKPEPPHAGAGADPAQPARPATLMEIIGAVFWSFFGVRKGEAMRRDAVTIKPHQIIIVGVVAAALLVAILLTLVRFITRAA